MDAVTRSQSLKLAQDKAELLFAEIGKRGFIRSGVSERFINEEIYSLAFELLGIKKYWHKRIVRAGPNTLFPYRENPPDLVVQNDDILFLDFGPILANWEADFGRTFVLGNDSRKLKLRDDVETVWNAGKSYFDLHPGFTAQELFKFTTDTASELGYHWGNLHCGHLIGEFPHENIPRDRLDGFIHADNQTVLRSADDKGVPRHWILGVHLTLPDHKIGAFREQLLTID